MADTVYVATIQVAVNPRVTGVENVADACDWFRGLLSEECEEAVLEWNYLKIGGQRLLPQAQVIASYYEEGDLFR